jgi:hypothetical protein
MNWHYTIGGTAWKMAVHGQVVSHEVGLSDGDHYL